MEIRHATIEDIPEIKKLFEKSSGRDITCNVDKYIKKYPSSYLLLNNKVHGFCYSKPFGPDIIEILNIFIEKSLRGKGFGKLLIEEFEKQSRNSFSAIILINSLLYKSNEKKILASNFYLECGFNELISTSTSTIYGKELASLII